MMLISSRMRVLPGREHIDEGEAIGHRGLPQSLQEQSSRPKSVRCGIEKLNDSFLPYKQRAGQSCSNAYTHDSRGECIKWITLPIIESAPKNCLAASIHLCAVTPHSI